MSGSAAASNRDPADDTLGSGPIEVLRGSALRVLLVEDDDAYAHSFAAAVSIDEPLVTIHRVPRLDEAVAVLGDERFDVVLADLGLPDANGLETVRALVTAAPSTPIVVLTGALDESLGREALKHGAQDFLTKVDAPPPSVIKSMRFAVERARLHVQRIAELRRTQELERRLGHADRLASIGQLSAGVAHEINSPASYVQVNLRAIKDASRQVSAMLDAVRGGLDARARSVLDEAMLAAGIAETLRDIGEMTDDSIEGMCRISTTVRELGSFSRTEAAEVELVDVNEVVRAGCRITEHEIRHRARLELELDAVPLVAADRVRLTQVVVNLLVNAAHAIADGEQEHNAVRVKTCATADLVVIGIEDTGHGIPETIRDRIFEPFFTTKPPGKGTGLGLALSAETVRRHGGELIVQSEVGRGTRFEIRLPRETGLRASVPPAAPVQPRPEERDGRVLLVDDERNLRRAYARVLKRRHDVFEAASGAEALSILEKDQAFDLILCDVMMPDMDGTSFLERLAARWPQIADRVVLMSGGVFAQRADEWNVSGERARIIEKPIAGDALLDLVAPYIRRRET